MATVVAEPRSVPHGVEENGSARQRTRVKRASLYALLIAALCTGITAVASTRTSTTFDEIVLMAGGARGYETGAWDIAPEHPPLMQYLYGLPIFLSRPQYPVRDEAPDRRDLGFRYTYAREFFFTTGNDPERLAFLGRAAGALMAGLLVLAVFAFTRRYTGDGEALLAAGLTAFLPDVLAHGGIAYNDLPLALGWLLAVWAFDSAARRPTPAAGVVAGLATAFALGTKFSAVLLVPVAALLVVAGALVNGRNGRWWRRLAVAVAVAAVTGYLAMVATYRGDLTLDELRYGIDYTFGHVSGGHAAPGYLKGDLSPTGWWYYFPVAFVYKTPVALHILLLAALAGLVRARAGLSLRSLAGSRLRAPVVAVAVFTAALLTSNLDIGFRYALPALPLICVLAAPGVGVLWRGAGRPLRAALAVLALWYAGSTLSIYPHFLAYTSEYGPGRDRGYEILLDSSLDWGQGLLDLRGWMRENDIPRVYLGYFGSAVPAGYGIEYVPLPSVYALPPLGPPPAEPLEYAVISATNLAGIYLAGDPFARFRSIEPDTVIARTLLVYRIDRNGNIDARDD